MEIRFNSETDVRAFVDTYPSVDVQGVKISIGRWIPPNLINTTNYAVTFFTNKAIEYVDVLREIKKYGTIRDITWHTIPNTPVKTGKYTIYITVESAEAAQRIPKLVEIGGQKVALKHRAAKSCITCNSWDTTPANVPNSKQRKSCSNSRLRGSRAGWKSPSTDQLIFKKTYDEIKM